MTPVIETSVEEINSCALAAIWLGPAFVTRPLPGIRFVYTPFVIPVTLTRITQPPAGMLVPLATVIVDAALVVFAQRGSASAVVVSSAAVSAPGDCGSASVRAAVIMIAVGFGLPSTMRNLDTMPGATSTGVNCLAKVGGDNVEKLALALTALVTPSSVFSELSAITLVNDATVLLSTSTEKVQAPVAGICAPVSCTVLPPGPGIALTATVEPGLAAQVVAPLGVADRYTPVGSVSARMALLSAIVFGFVIVTVSRST